jgi:replicative DNA helicase
MAEAADELKKLKEARYRNTLKSLKELKAEQLEEVSIGAEMELSTRDIIKKGELLHISEIASDIEAASKEWGRVGGTSTGLPSLDARIGGLRGGDIIMFAGNPGGGKSALAGNIAVNVSRGAHVLFISLEMLPKRIGARFMYYNNGTINGLNISFQKESIVDYRSLRALFEKASDKGMKLAVLDYFQYLGRGMDMNEVAKMSVVCKKLAQEFEVPFIIILSLRKGGTQFSRKWTDVELEDLMGTSAIGYDADAVIVASRTDPQNKPDPDHQWLKVVKVRDMPNDPSDYIRLHWDKTKVSEIKGEPEWIPSDEDIEEIDEKELDNRLL